MQYLRVRPNLIATRKSDGSKNSAEITKTNTAIC